MKRKKLQIVPSFLRKQFLLTRQAHQDILVMSIEDIQGKFCPELKSGALYYIYKNCNENYDYAKTLYEALKFLKPNKIKDNSKIKKLNELEGKLRQEGLLLYNEAYINYLRSLDIVNNCYSDELIASLLKPFKLRCASNPDSFDAGLKVKVYPNELDEINEVSVQIADLLASKKAKSYEICMVIPQYLHEMCDNFFKNLSIPLVFDNNLISLQKEYLDSLEIIKTDPEQALNNFLESSSDISVHLYNILSSVLEENKDDKRFIYLRFVDKVKSFSYLDNSIGIRVVTNIEEAARFKYVFVLNFDDSYPSKRKDDEYLSDAEKIISSYSYPSYLCNEKKKEELNILLHSVKNLYLFRINDSLMQKDKILVSELEEEGKITPEEGEYYNCRYSKYNDFVYFAYEEEVEKNYGNNCSRYLETKESCFSEGFEAVRAKNTDILISSAPNKKISFSSISDYLNCPFAYFCKRILNINKFDNNLSLMIGNVVHKIVECQITSEESGGSISPTNLSFSKVLKLLDIDESGLSKKDIFYLQKAYLRGFEVVSILKKFFKVGHYTKIYSEKQFDYSFYSSKIEGRVDLLLINRDENEYSILDLKTGSKNFDLNKIAYGLDVQLLLYSLAFKETLEQEGYRQGDVFYAEVYKDKSLYSYSDVSEFHGLSAFGINGDKDRLTDKDSNEDLIVTYKKLLDYQLLLNTMKKSFEDGIEKLKEKNFSVLKKRLKTSNSKLLSNCEYCQFKECCFVDNSDKDQNLYLEAFDKNSEETE